MPASDLVEEVQFRNDTSVPAKSVHAYESSRGIVKDIENIWRPNAQTPATLSKYDYTNNTLGLRTNVEYSGVAFGSTSTQSFGYNPRNELTSSNRSGTAAWQYDYDPPLDTASLHQGQVGNRLTSQQALQQETTYHTNELNQYLLLDNAYGRRSIF